MDNEKSFSQKQIKIYTANRQLYMVTGRQNDRLYPIAVGKPSTPTPPGTYHIINKIVNPGGGLGTRWMGLDIPDGPYGIHGTFKPESIGKAVSNGCIRMYNHDVEELFSKVKVGTTVVIENFTATTEKNFAHYTVRPGDTLWKISRQFGLTIDEIAGFNDIVDPNTLQVGQELKIPSTKL